MSPWQVELVATSVLPWSLRKRVGTTGKDGSGQRHLETSSSEIDELMRSAGANHVNFLNSRVYENHSTTKPANTSFLTVSPLRDENAMSFNTTHQMLQLGFRASPPPIGMSISTMPRINAPSVDNLVAQTTEHSVNNLTTRNLITKIGDAQYSTPSAKPLPHLNTHGTWNPLDPALHYPWFLQNLNTPLSSHTDHSIMRSSLSSALTSPGDRTLPSRSHSSINKAGCISTSHSYSHSYSHSQSYLNSPALDRPLSFSLVPPLANPLSITPNSSLISEGSLCSDGEDDDSAVGGAAPSVFCAKRKMSYPGLDDGRGTKFPKTQYAHFFNQSSQALPKAVDPPVCEILIWFIVHVSKFG